ncbi:MAG: hypothetical protein WBN09_02260, partial [Woeseiaceae bacterium]
SGVVAEGETMSISVACSYSAGLRDEFEAIAGNYQGDKFVLDIASDGSTFSQNAGTGCVVNAHFRVSEVYSYPVCSEC